VVVHPLATQLEVQEEFRFQCPDQVVVLRGLLQDRRKLGVLLERRAAAERLVGPLDHEHCPTSGV
jgi:hypothetical protein